MVIGSMSVQTLGRKVQESRLSVSLAAFNIHDWLVPVYFTIPDLQVEITIRVGADPRFVIDRCPLTTELR